MGYYFNSSGGELAGRLDAAEQAHGVFAAPVPETWDGRQFSGDPHFEEFVVTGGRWTDAGNSSGGFTTNLDGSGGVVGWSLIGAGLSDQSGAKLYSGLSVALGSFLPFDFEAVLREAFDWWAEVANIEFVQVQDGGGNWGAGGIPTIRIAGGFTDGAGGNLAWAFFPSGNDMAGDIVFDSGHPGWSAANFLHVAAHEIGHAIGLNHQSSPPVAIMNPSVNMSNPLTELQPDDIAGARFVYGNQDFGPNSFFMPAGQTSLNLIDAAPNLTVVGNSSSNNIVGTSANERFEGAAGNDMIDGNAGNDTAIFEGAFADYSFERLASGAIRVLDNVAARDGIDTLVRVEQVQFADQTVAVADLPFGFFALPSFKLAAFARNAGGWSNDDVYPRHLGDVNGDGMDDIVGFGNAGVFVSPATGAGSFSSPSLKLGAFGRNAGGWSRDDVYPRHVGDVNGDGLEDIVGFGDAGVFVSLATGGGSFSAPSLKLGAFGRNAGGWSSDDLYPRHLGDVNGDGMDDIVGFGNAGVFVSLATGGGSFSSPSLKLAAFGRNAGGWSSDVAYPRHLGDVNGDGMDDIVGFGNAGVVVALATGGGSFSAPSVRLAAFGRNAGGWSSDDLLPRHVGDINDDGMEDIVGFGDAGVAVSLATGGGSFAAPRLDVAAFGRNAGGWSSDELYPRHLGDVNGDGAVDIAGFGANGVSVSLSAGSSSSPATGLQIVAQDASLDPSSNLFPADTTRQWAEGLSGFGSGSGHGSLSNGDGRSLFAAGAAGTYPGGWSGSEHLSREYEVLRLDGAADVDGFATAGLSISPAEMDFIL